jgi:hypothetical protein
MKSSPNRLLIVSACLLLAISMTACKTAATSTVSTASMPMSFGCTSPVREVPPPAPEPAPAPIVAAPAPEPAPYVAPAPEPVPAPAPARRTLRKN